MGRNILSNVEKFAGTSLDDDLQRISTFFGISKTSRTMHELIGSSPSSLSRAKSGQTASLRAAKHIAVVAAFTIEIEKHLSIPQGSVGSSPPDPANMHRWLLSGRMVVEGVRRTPMEVLSNYELAVAALKDVRMERDPSPSELPESDGGERED